jgi:hypothetical protein
MRVTRGSNADIVTHMQKPHRQEVDAPVVVQRGQVRNEYHRKELVDLGRAKDEVLVCRVSGAWLVICL